MSLLTRSPSQIIHLSCVVNFNLLLKHYRSQRIHIGLIALRWVCSDFVILTTFHVNFPTTWGSITALIEWVSHIVCLANKTHVQLTLSIWPSSSHCCCHLL